MTLSAGTKLGPYEILSPIGAGGMGEVYRARDERLKREVAIKVLPTSFAADAERLRRFEQEAQAAGALNHPNITAVHDFGSVDGAPYIVTELLEGETLRARMAGGAVPVRKATDYAIQMARGLAGAATIARTIRTSAGRWRFFSSRLSVFRSTVPDRWSFGFGARG